MKPKTSWELSLISLNKKQAKDETKKFVKKWGSRVDYLSDPKILKIALTEYEIWQNKFGANASENYFFGLQNILDQSDPKIKSKLNLSTKISKELENDIQFFELRLSKIKPQYQTIFLKDNLLKDYHHFLERLFQSGKHLLSEPEEKIMNLKSQTSYDLWVRLTEEFLAKEEIKSKNFSEIVSLIDSQNKTTRDSAALALNSIFTKHADLAESEINAVLTDKRDNDYLRKFESPDQARLLSDDINREVVEAMISVVSKNYNIAARLYELKAKLLKVPFLAYHERNVPIGKIEKTYSFEKTTELISQVFKNLHPKFNDIFQSFLKNGQIDVFPNKGKHSGAACWHSLKSLPTYILLNHTDKLRDVTTLAHELGHGINNELAKEKQNSLNFGTPTSTAEVASTFFEDFIFQEILKNTNDEEKLSLLISKLGDDISTIFRQVAFYQFELELHQSFRTKGYLSKEEIGSFFQKHMKSYMGEFVEQSKGSQNWWIYVSHFRYFFYVYSYAGGLLISKALQNKVKKDPKYILKVCDFLASGLSDSPKNIFLKLGIDITKANFWETGIKEIEENLDEAWKLAHKLGKI